MATLDSSIVFRAPENGKRDPNQDVLQDIQDVCNDELSPFVFGVSHTIDMTRDLIRLRFTVIPDESDEQGNRDAGQYEFPLNLSMPILDVLQKLMPTIEKLQRWEM